MTIEQFDEKLREAASGTDFGPMSGFGGQGSRTVFDNLPGPIQELYRKWNIPTALLANRNPGPCVRDYAEACGIQVNSDISSLK